MRWKLTLLCFCCTFWSFSLAAQESERPAVLLAKVPYQQDWDFYVTQEGDSLSSIVLDLGFWEAAPIKDKHYISWVSVQLTQPRADGLSDPDEAEDLGAVEDALDEAMRLQHNANYVGRVTTEGHRDFYFYLGDPSLYERTIYDIMQAFPAYRYSFGSRLDVDWKGYFELLYPKPVQYQHMRNRRRISELEEQGDEISKPRPVQHALRFKTETDRSHFLEVIAPDGYQLAASEEELSQEFPYGLQISRVDPVDPEAVESYTTHLLELAARYQGLYEGWQAGPSTE